MEPLTRYRERQSTDRADLDRLLDTEWWGVLAVVRGGHPVTVPTLYVRDGDWLLVHGSSGAHTLGVRGHNARASFCVTAMDALVVAVSSFDSSAAYRSAVISGVLEPATDQQRDSMLERFTDGLLPGRTEEIRASTKKELAKTSVLRLPIAEGEWIYKARPMTAPGVPDDPADAGTSAWSGLVPMTRGFGVPVTSDWCTAEVPASVRNLAG